MNHISMNAFTDEFMKLSSYVGHALTGGAIGAGTGALAGGEGNRLRGALAGGGAGALTGLGIKALLGKRMQPSIDRMNILQQRIHPIFQGSALHSQASKELPKLMKKEILPMAAGQLAATGGAGAIASRLARKDPEEKNAGVMDAVGKATGALSKHKGKLKWPAIVGGSILGYKGLEQGSKDWWLGRKVRKQYEDRANG